MPAPGSADVADDDPVVAAVVEGLEASEVTFALLFGTRATGQATEHSDVDVAVWSHKPIDLWELQGSLPDGVDLVDLRHAPDGLTGRISITGKILIDRDPPARVRWLADTRKRYLDEAPRRARFRRDFADAHG